MSGPDVCEHGNPGDRPCAQCVAAAPVAPEPSAQFTQQERRAIARVERDINEFDEDDRLAIRALLRAVDFRGVSVPASAARILPSWVYPLWDAALNVVATSEACHPMARGASALEVAVRELKAAIEIAPCGAEVEAASRARSVLGGETTQP